MKTMPTATLQLNIVPRRMLTKNEAAAHCGRPPKRFEIECPVKPLKFPNGDQRYDVVDLDRWLNSLKLGNDAGDADEILRVSVAA